MLEYRARPGQEGRGSARQNPVVNSGHLRDAAILLVPGEGIAMAPAHSPSIAHACVQSSGVLALHPSKGVRSSPPLIASAGSSGTAVVARKLARLSWSAVTHSSADLRLAGWAIRRAFGAGASLEEEPWAAVRGMISGVAWSISTSAVPVGICPVTMIKPALSSALASVARRTAGGHWLELAIVLCCIASALLALSVMRLTNSAISNNEVGTQSESISAKFTVGNIRHSASRAAAPAQV